jgi:ABC-2 type transport system permease protein
MAVAMGVGIAFIAKNQIVMSSIITFMIPIIGFLGGSYVALPRTGMLGEAMKRSPVRWTNDAMFGIIYGKDYSNLAKAILINLIVGFIFIAIASIRYRREAISR